VIVAPFHPAHLLEIRAQPAQPKDFALFSDPEYGEQLLAGDAFSVFDAAGQVQAVLGVAPLWENRGAAWAVLSGECGPVFVAMHKQAKAYFDRCRFARVEAYIDPNFPQAVRWIELLGFQREGLMRKFTPAGADNYLYSRVR
jgi:hypothetical protein